MTPERLVSRAIDRRYVRYELQGVDRELNQWGRWIEMRIDYEGYPSVSVGMQLINWGTGVYGDRILCLDMPTHIYAVHGRVLRLQEHERDAVWIWYVIRVKPDGTLWPIDHKCRQAGITEAALRQRVSRARRKIAGLPILEEVAL
jgi:hypothetical protein